MIKVYPNPFRESTTINYTLDKSGWLTITIYNLLGEETETLFAGIQTQGSHQIKWTVNSLQAGIYIVQIQSNEFRVTKKISLQE